MKKFLSVIVGLTFSVGVINAQSTNVVSTNTTASIGDVLGTVGSFLSAGSNWMVAPYGIASVDGKKFGGGIGIGYKVSDYVVPTLRLDYYNGQIWMPSGSLQLQVPVKFGKLTVIPLAFTGVAVPVQGKSSDVVVGIIGAGAAVQFNNHFDLIADYEKWTGIGDQIRLGFVYKF